MASLLNKQVSFKIALNYFRPFVFCKRGFRNRKLSPSEQLKQALIKNFKKNDNPYDMRVVKREAGSKDKPNEIQSAFDSRLIGCICTEDSVNISWMWLHKDKEKQCECGHWFKLVQKNSLV